MNLLARILRSIPIRPRRISKGELCALIPRILILRSPRGAANRSPRADRCAGDYDASGGHGVDDGRTSSVDVIDGFSVVPERDLRGSALCLGRDCCKVIGIPFPFVATGGATLVNSSSHPIIGPTSLQSISSPNL